VRSPSRVRSDPRAPPLFIFRDGDGWCDRRRARSSRVLCASTGRARGETDPRRWPPATGSNSADRRRATALRLSLLVIFVTSTRAREAIEGIERRRRLTRRISFCVLAAAAPATAGRRGTRRQRRELRRRIRSSPARGRLQMVSGADSRSPISEFIYPFAKAPRTRAGRFFLALFAAPATAGRRGTRRQRRELRRRIRSSPARQRLQTALLTRLTTYWPELSALRVNLFIEARA
jgi:hypothetical protein